MVALLTVELPCSLEEFWRSFWANEGFYLQYLKEEQSDIDITVGRWNEPDDGIAAHPTLTRLVECRHPLKVSFPGTPSHARCRRQQEASVQQRQHGQGTELHIVESTRFDDIPYSDYFTVECRWLITESPVGDAVKAKDADDGVTLSIDVEVHFIKSTWLRNTISANTKSESLESLVQWGDLAKRWLVERPRRAASPRTVLLRKQLHAQDATTPDLSHTACPRWFSVALTPSSGRSRRTSKASAASSTTPDAPTAEPVRGPFAVDTTPPHTVVDVPESQNGYFLGEEDEFFDAIAEDEHLLLQPYDDTSLDWAEDRSVPPEASVRVLKEAAFVLCEFVVWKIRSLSLRTVAPYFTPPPALIARRLLGALVPCSVAGGAADVANKPDLYVPTMLVLTLAQILVWCIDFTGTHHGHCRRETLLGTSIAVSVGNWLGAALWYHLISYILGARLRFLQSLAVSGYGLIGWCAALVLCQLLVLIRKIGVSLSLEIPLLVFGVPSGVAMGLIFSQQTPVRLRGPALIWLWPKLLCFALVVLTHYELLRYLFHVVIPGEQELCALWSALQPEDFAVFLGQQELRHYQQVLKQQTGLVM